MVVYIHKETGEIIEVPDELNSGYDMLINTDVWDDDIQKVEENVDDYIAVRDMPSSMGYKVMEDFAGKIEDETTRMVLDVVLSNAKPFRNFKNTLYRFPEVRNDWFHYKQERMKQWVVEQIEGGQP